MLKNPIIKTAVDVSPVIRIADIIKLFILSIINVFKSVLLNPNFSSITNVLYKPNGKFKMSVIINNPPKKNNPVIISPYPKDLTN